MPSMYRKHGRDGCRGCIYGRDSGGVLRQSQNTFSGRQSGDLSQINTEMKTLILQTGGLATRQLCNPLRQSRILTAIAASNLIVTTQLFSDEPITTEIRTKDVRPVSESRTRSAITGFVIAVQSVLFLAHWFVYWTWTAFQATDPVAATTLKAALAVLSSAFVASTLLAFRYYNAAVRTFYRIAATWLGFFNFFFWAAGLSWLILGAARLSGSQLSRPIIAEVIFGAAALVGIYGIVNAKWVRVRNVTVKLPNLPRSWRGRTAALISDLHLGHVNGAAFARRVVAKTQGLDPNIVFIAGDLFDGSKVNAHEVVQPLAKLSAEYGTYFVTGNHEEFSDPRKFTDAVTASGIQMLDNEKVVVDGLQIVGVNHSDSTEPARFRSVLAEANIDQDRASVLLSHSPHALSVVEEAGVSLQLSGHTHGGQITPFTWLTHRIFGNFTYGLARFGSLMVYTSSGVGTWGPPMRVGTRPEIVLIRFE